MTSVAVVDLPSEAFVLGRIVGLLDDYYAELTRFVPTDDQFVPYVWVENGNLAAVESELRNHERIGRVVSHEVRADCALFEIRWASPLDDFFAILRDADVLVLEAEGTPERWTFTLLATERDELAAFQSARRDRDVPIDVRELRDAGESSAERDDITRKQRAILRAACDRGYFEVPREVTLSELARDLDISPQAASKLLRRGVANAVEETLDDT